MYALLKVEYSKVTLNFDALTKKEETSYPFCLKAMQSKSTENRAQD